MLGHPEWRDDPRFATNSARMANLDALTTLMDAVLATRTQAEWIARFDAAGVPVGPVNSIGEALAHPQTLARGMVVDLVHPQAGPTKALGCPIHFSETPTRDHAAGAAAGRAHARGAARARLCGREIDAFVAAGVVEDASGSARRNAVGIRLHGQCPTNRDCGMPRPLLPV